MSARSNNDGKSEWDKKCDAIEDAFRKLPRRNLAKAGSIPYEALIPGVARQLMVMKPVPRSPTAPPSRALRDLEKSTAAAIDALSGLPPSVAGALNFKHEALRRITGNLRILHAAIKMAKPPQPSGAPKKIQPAKIARVVAGHYHGLTGNRPTVPKKQGVAYGPFPDLLDEVFKILDVKASAISQAENVVRNW